jgi:hypothetical protein
MLANFGAFRIFIDIFILFRDVLFQIEIYFLRSRIFFIDFAI